MGLPRKPCEVCPIYSAGWCAHHAKRVSPLQAACDFGCHQMRLEHMRQYSRTHRAKPKAKRASRDASVDGDRVRDLGAGVRIVSRGRIPWGGHCTGSSPVNF